MKKLKLSSHRLLAIIVFLIVVNPAASGQIQISLPVETGEVGQSFLLAVNTGSVSGENVTAFQFTISFDNAIINLTGIDQTGTLSSSLVCIPNTNIPGEITVGCFGATALSGSGTLLNLSAELLAEGTSPLEWKSFIMNAGTPSVSTTDGKFTVTTVPEEFVYTVQSENPASGVSIAVSPNDIGGESDGVTQFARTYIEKTQITLTAPVTASGNSFKQWLLDGIVATSNQSLIISLSRDRTAIAVYETPLPETHLLTVHSVNPASGVSIAVSPNDSSGQGNGTTQFTRIYNTNIQVTLMAPATADGNMFEFWLLDGLVATTNQTLVVSVDSDHDATAHYRDPIADNDADGIPNSTEDGAPNSGDGNEDGIPDSEQSNVASFVSSVTSKYVTLSVVETGVKLESVFVEDDISSFNPPVSRSFPIGLISFSLVDLPAAGQTVTVQLFVHDNPSTIEYWKYGPTPDNIALHWYPFVWNGITGAIPRVYGFDIVLKDGERGDSDLISNGRIEDPGAPSVISVSNEFEDELPEAVRLSPNYPNPFSNTTSIVYENNQSAHIRLVVTDLLGRVRKILVDGHRAAGVHKVTLFSDDLENGTYVYSLEIGHQILTRKMIVIK